MRIACLNHFGRIAVSRARSFLVYLSDMSRHSLRGFLRFIPKNEFLKAPAVITIQA